MGSKLPELGGYPFEVRYSEGALMRAQAVADLAAKAYVYFRHWFTGAEPDIALIVADEVDWSEHLPYELAAFFRDDPSEIRPGIVLMPSGDFWVDLAEDLRDAFPRGYKKLLAAYPDGSGGVDLQPFFDLITIHEIGHAFEVLGDLRLPTFWLSEIFANLAMHAFVATQLPAKLPTLKTLPTVGAGSRKLAARVRAEGYSTLDELQAHYTGDWADPLNYLWFQHRWLRLAAKMFEVDGEDGLVRFWDCFHSVDRVGAPEATAASLVPLLAAEVSTTLAREVRDWH